MRWSTRSGAMKTLFAILCGVCLIWIIFAARTPPYEPGNIEQVIHCSTNYEDRRAHLPVSSAGVRLYIVTPTYRRAEQVPELLRLGQTLLTVPSIHWIVSEDHATCSQTVAQLLSRLGMPYTHLASPMPAEYRHLTYVPRGVANRRAAINWLRSANATGVLYFLDDDNTIDIRLFEEMRRTRRLSMFPVGFVTDLSVSAPIIKDGVAVAFFDGWLAGRTFAVDMAGFAINLRVLAESRGTMPYHAGYEEDKLLQNLGLRISDIEPLANQCTEVMVWHTKTKKNKVPDLSGQRRTHAGTSVEGLVRYMESIYQATGGGGT